MSATAESWPPLWASLTLMFQKEVAQRLRLKYAAKIKFLADESFDVAGHIDKLLADPKVQRDLAAED